jgi:hypothetical protein
MAETEMSKTHRKRTIGLLVKMILLVIALLISITWVIFQI